MSALNTNTLNQIFDVVRQSNGVDILVTLMNNKENEIAIAEYLNSLLQTAVKRIVGFSYINQLFPYLSQESLKQYGVIWLTKCLDLKIQYSKIHFDLIINLINHLDKNQEFHKYVVTNGLQKIIEKCLIMNNYADNLICLDVCLQTYASTCITYKDKIENFLLQILCGNSNTYIVKQSGRCLHFLQQVGGCGADGIHHKTNWSTTLKKLCSTLHNQYDLLFENITEYNDYDKIDVDPYKFPDFAASTSAIQMQNIVTNRVINLILYIQSFLESKYPTVKNVPPQIILDVIKRGLSTHNCISANTISITDLTLRNNLIKIHIKLMYMLRSFLACIQNNSIPYTTVITKILLDTLIQTKKCPCFQSNSEYSNAIYKVFIYWIELAKNKIDTTCHIKLISFIAEEIKPVKSCVKLAMKLSKKNTRKRKSNEVSTIVDSESSQNSYSQIREVNCENALRLLKSMLKYVVLYIGINKFKELYDIVVRILVNVQGGIEENPYTNKKCVELLYNVLITFFEQPFTNFWPAFDANFTIFLNGQKSKNKSISLLCSQGISMIEKLAQSVYPTLYVFENNTNTQETNNNVNNDTEQTNFYEDITNSDENINENLIDTQLTTSVNDSHTESMKDVENLIDPVSVSKDAPEMNVIEDYCDIDKEINNEDIQELKHFNEGTHSSTKHITNSSINDKLFDNKTNGLSHKIDNMDEDMMESFNDVLAES